MEKKFDISLVGKGKMGPAARLNLLRETTTTRYLMRYKYWKNSDTIHRSFLTMATETFVLPGDHLNPDSLPSHPKLPLKLGPGLQHIPPNIITPTIAGLLCTDKRKNAVWVESNTSRVGGDVPSSDSWLIHCIVYCHDRGLGDRNNTPLRQ